MPQTLLDVEIDSLSASGDGLARAGRLTVVVPFTIPGERVRIQMMAPGHRTEVSATVVAVLRASPHRVAARCPHFGPDAEPGVGPCGGCTWQHIAYPEQLRLKTALVDRLVRATVPKAPPALPMIPSTSIEQPWGYRHKVHFVFGNAAARRGPARAGPYDVSKAGPEHGLVMGHYVRGSRRVIPVRECSVHDPRGNGVAFGFRDTFARAGIEAADDLPAGLQPPSHEASAVRRGGPRRRTAQPALACRVAQRPDLGGGGSKTRPTLRSIAIRVGANTPDIMTTLVVGRDTDKTLRAATRRAMATGAAPTSLHLNIHPGRDAFIFGRETRRIAGPERMRERVGDTSFLISPTAFFQTNVHAADILVRLVLAEVPEGANVLDLYAGAGLFALPLARAGCDVIAVEGNRLAVADGEASLRLNRIRAGTCRFVARPVESWRPAAPHRAGVRGGGPAGEGRPTEFDVVVLDPPREGCAPSVVREVFGRLRPGRAIYVSCNPEALARDLRSIAGHGYAIRSLQPVDMFPHTAHIETVVVVTR